MTQPAPLVAELRNKHARAYGSARAAPKGQEGIRHQLLGILARQLTNQNLLPRPG
jgi:hypothetical protein